MLYFHNAAILPPPPPKKKDEDDSFLLYLNKWNIMSDSSPDAPVSPEGGASKRTEQHNSSTWSVLTGMAMWLASSLIMPK